MLREITNADRLRLGKKRSVACKKDEDDDSKPQLDSDGEDEEENGQSRTRALDRICLALGVLTNLVQMLNETRDILRQISSCILVSYFLDNN
jgi:hypothetical protein